MLARSLCHHKIDLIVVTFRKDGPIVGIYTTLQAAYLDNFHEPDNLSDEEIKKIFRQNTFHINNEFSVTYSNANEIW